jgi:hypothetical protein
MVIHPNVRVGQNWHIPSDVRFVPEADIVDIGLNSLLVRISARRVETQR